MFPASTQGPREGGGQSHCGAGDVARTPHFRARGVAEIGSVESQGGGGLQGDGREWLRCLSDGFSMIQHRYNGKWHDEWVNRLI